MGSSLAQVGSFTVLHGSSRSGTWAHELWHVGSLVVASGLSCPAACGILVPSRGIEPVSPALQGRFLTTREVPASELLSEGMQRNI